MKKLLAGLFIFGFLFIGIQQAHAFTLNDALLQIQNLQKDIASLKAMMKGSALNPIVPTVIIPFTPSSIGSVTATLVSQTTNLGYPASITEQGACYGTSPSPTNCVSTTSTTSTGFAYTDIKGLNRGTKYYYRGYAKNATGTGYSADSTFTTTSNYVNVIANTSYTVEPGKNISLAYTTNTNLGTTLCILLNSNYSSSPTSNYQSSSPISFTAPNEIGSYGYYIKCVSSLNDVIEGYSPLITVNVVRPAALCKINNFSLTSSVINKGDSVTVNYNLSDCSGFGLGSHIVSDPSNTWTVTALNKSVNSLIRYPVASTDYWLDVQDDNGYSYKSSSIRVTVNSTSLAPVNGVFSAWSDYGACVNGSKPQIRSCNNPSPSNGGASCSGLSSQQVSCNVQSYPPTLTSQTAQNVTTSGAVLTATVIDEGSSSVTEKGICYGTTSSSTNCEKSLYAQTMRNLTNLLPGTTYKFIGYAKNSVGTGWSEERSFKTLGAATKSADIPEDNGCLPGYKYSKTISNYLCPDSSGLKSAGIVNPDNTNNAPISRTLKQGTRGEDVRILQIYLGIGADGIFGRGTAAAVKAWQVTNGLTPDGFFGKNSYRKMSGEQ